MIHELFIQLGIEQYFELFHYACVGILGLWIVYEFLCDFPRKK